MKLVARSFRFPLLLGASITALGFLMFFAVPNRNTYIAAPGVLIAWMANGGVHGNGLDNGFDFWFWAVAASVNLLVYSVVAWFCVTMIFALKARRLPSGE